MHIIKCMLGIFHECVEDEGQNRRLECEIITETYIIYVNMIVY